MQEAGVRLGQYEIVRALGAGGMGEVYLARDTRLGRTVAVKLLPDAFAQEGDRIARFEREAKLLASLNHAGIAALYGLEESSSPPRHFLVMELVEGETLAERIARGPIPVEEALTIAHQIAEALEFAHAKGVIHRDLKPANVKITPDGKVKVLDFGLAKAMAPAAQADILSSPTLSVAGTMPGVILGTAPYMSPEQAKGIEADQRSDIFSFGAVLYEMLTGRHSFPGDTVTEVIASVLARQPDLTTLPANINPRIEELIRRCLEKDAKRRRQAIGDVRVEIESVLADPNGAQFRGQSAHQRPDWRRTALISAATAVVVAAATAATMWTRQPPHVAATTTRFPFVLPEGQLFTRTGRQVLAISPDGTRLVYVANNQLYLRLMSEMESRPIAGTNLDVSSPVFSPDGQWVAFHSSTENKLRKIAITGGTSVTICDAQNPFGLSWGADNQILFAAASTGGVLRVSGNGGKPESVITINAGEQAQNPQLLADGDTVLFTLVTGSNADRWDRAQIVVQSLKSHERRVVVEGGSNARLLPTGHLVYALGATVLAVPFDVNSLKITGGSVPVTEGVQRATAGAGAAQVAFSDSGTMVYVEGTAENLQGRILVLIGRDGARKELPLPDATYFHPRISPDGKRLAVHSDDGKEVVVSVYDLAGTTAMRRLAFGSANRFPMWSRDGQRIVFQSDREKDGGLFWQRADGSGQVERLTKPDDPTVIHSPDSWSKDGTTLIYSVNAGLGSGDSSVWSVSIQPGAKPQPVIDLPGSLQDRSSISPDGRWIAYRSNETGRPEIFVQPFPPSDPKYQVTTTSGPSTVASQWPIWSPDGKQIIFARGEAGIADLWAVDVQTQPTFTYSQPVELPIKRILHNGAPGMPRGFDITPDGKQFIVMLAPSEAEANQVARRQINVTLNWFDELRRRVPNK